MRLMTNHGMRVDRHPSDLDKLLTLARRTPYREMNEAAKLRLMLLLELQHAERERIRFAPIH
jgi:hypothetical protein